MGYGWGMSEPHLFITIFGAVLGALLLAGAFFWGMVTYTKLERDERQWSKQGNTPLIAMVVPMGFLILSIIAAMP